MNIKLENICKSYDKIVDNKKQKLCVFDNFNLEFEENKITCILGESGSGKTTLLNILANLTKFGGKVQGTSKKISYIFQKSRLLPNLTVKGNLQFVLGKNQDEKIEQMLNLLEIGDKAESFPEQLSGGQAQRVAIARAFLYPSKLLLMDEPFSSLDTALKIRLTQDFVKLWSKDKRTVVFVTHDVEEASMLAQRVVVLKAGKVVADLPTYDAIPRQYGKDNPIKQNILDVILQ